MLSNLLFFALGLVTLVAGAEVLVRGAARLALSFGVSPLVIGLTVVAFGTSTPELAVSVGAALDGKPDLAIGNVVGSNIANVLLILGAAAIIVPLAVAEQIIRQEIPIMIGASLLMVVMALDAHIGVLESGLFLALIVAYTLFLIRQSRSASREVSDEFASEIPTSSWDAHWAVQVALVAAGLALLVLGANWLVDAAVAVARTLGVSDLVIGLTVVAVGTSMPELATSVLAVIKGERDIAVGNVVGSCIFNLLLVLGAGAAVAADGLSISPNAQAFDFPVMLAVFVACLPIFFSGYCIRRWEGLMFFAYYLAYTLYLVMFATGLGAIELLRDAMLWFAFPLTTVTLLVIFLRAWQHQR